MEPFSPWTWLKLMVIVFFVGTGAGGFGSIVSNLGNLRRNSTSPYFYSNSQASQTVQNILSNTGLLVLVIVGVILLIILFLVFMYLRNVFSFVLIRALATGDVRVIRPALDNLGRGFRLFIFTLAVSIIGLIIAAIMGGLIVLGIVVAVHTGTATAGSVLLILAIAIVAIALVLLLIVFLIGWTIFLGFTYDFAAPMMLNKDMGVMQAWRQLWGSIKSNWQQYGVYVIVRLVLQIVTSILLIIVMLPLLLIFLAVLAVGAIIATAAAGTAIWLTVIVGLLMAILVVIAVIVGIAISMPVSVYFRYYSLDVLKQIDPTAITFADKFTFPPPEQGKLPP